MKKSLSILLALVMTAVMTLPTASAAHVTDSGQCGENTRWSLNDGQLVISGSGRVTDTPWLDHRDEIVTVYMERGIEAIPDRAFENCPAMERITVEENNRFYHSDEDGVLISGGASACIIHAPAKLGAFYVVRTESVGERAFSDCKGLKCVKINWAVSVASEAFRGCEALETVVFGAMPEIGENAFADTGGLRVYGGDIPDSDTGRFPTGTEIYKIADSGSCGEKSDYYSYGDAVQWLITEDGELMIYGQGRMTDYSGWTMPGWRGEDVKRATVTDGVEYLGDYAFAGCTAMEHVTLPRDVELGNIVFYNCVSLKEITLPENLSGIGYEMFDGCRSLTEIAIPDTVTVIDQYAFSGCSGLTELTIPAGVRSIGEMAFRYCQGLKELRFLGSRPTIHESAFYYDVFTAYRPAGDDSWSGIENTVFALSAITWKTDRLTGDIDGDGAITNSDLVTLARHIVGFRSEDAAIYGDMDGNGVVDNTDIVIMARVIVGIK